MKRILIQWTPAVFNSLCLGLLVCAFAAVAPGRARASDLSKSVSSATEQAEQTLDETSKAAQSEIEELWKRVDESRLKNRTPDEIVAWVLVGLLVGGVLARFMGIRPLTAVAIGLVGSFLGGIVVHVAQINLGLGPVLIRYEDLIFSLVGSLLAVVGIRLILKRKQQKG